MSSALAKGTREVRGTMGKNQKADITTAGRPGLVLVSPSGTPIPGAIVGPTPPGSSEPVDAAANLAPVGSTDAGSTPNGGTPGGNGNTPAK